MDKNKKPGILNYILPLIMVLFGIRHYFKHGLDLMAVIPVIFGLFALYMVLFNHSLLQQTEKIIIKLWYPVGQLITFILLTATFYLVFTPVSIVLRWMGKDILNKAFKVNHFSYWVDRSAEEKSNYTKQF